MAIGLLIYFVYSQHHSKVQAQVAGGRASR